MGSGGSGSKSKRTGLKAQQRPTPESGSPNSWDDSSRVPLSKMKEIYKNRLNTDILGRLGHESTPKYKEVAARIEKIAREQKQWNSKIKTNVVPISKIRIELAKEGIVLSKKQFDRIVLDSIHNKRYGASSLYLVKTKTKPKLFSSRSQMVRNVQATGKNKYISRLEEEKSRAIMRLDSKRYEQTSKEIRNWKQSGNTEVSYYSHVAF